MRLFIRLRKERNLLANSNKKQFFMNFGREEGEDKTNHLILASDGFFPFGDSVEEASKINITHVVQPGGSIADKTVISMCNALNICMVATGIRAFHH